MKHRVVVIIGLMLTLFWGSLNVGGITLADSSSKYTNHLVDAVSPYLRQHANNPVDWYPWGEEALKKAREENKPILLSIGYSTCYWCHVMEREIFSKPAIAKIMNKHFVNIKIDREERPDIDTMYMLATNIIHGQGGWPNNVFLTPNLAPFFAGTTFTYDQFEDALNQLIKAWDEQEANVRATAEYVGRQMHYLLVDAANNPPVELDDIVADLLYESMQQSHDNREGGFGTGMKFPMEGSLLYLIDYYRYKGEKHAIDMSILTLNKIAAGGIHDHVGGGFHRYATDPHWHVPHFEKMLYNQAQLARTYTDLYTVSKNPYYKTIVESTFAYVEEEMLGERGEFYSALDAETDAVEGAYYVWKDTNIKALLTDKQYKLFKKLYDYAKPPEFKGHKHPDGEVIYLKKPLMEAAIEQKMTYEALAKQVETIMGKLEKARQKRKLPHLDYKAIASWNWMMVDAYARAAEVFDSEHYLAVAESAAGFLLKELKDKDDIVYRIYAKKKRYVRGFLEDYTYAIQGLVSLYKVTNKSIYLDHAKALTAKVDALFLDAIHGGYYYSDGSDKDLLRIKDGTDMAIASGNAVMVHAMLDLFELTEDVEWFNKANHVIHSFSADIVRSPKSYVHLVHGILRRNHLLMLSEIMTQPVANDNRVVQEVKQSSHSKAYVSLDAELESYKGGVATVLVTLTPKRGWHINANPASLSFLIPTTVDVQTDIASEVQTIKYPKAKKLTSPLAKEAIEVYKGKTVVKVAVKLDPPAKMKQTTLRILSQFQACKDTVCLRPSDVVHSLPIKW